MLRPTDRRDAWSATRLREWIRTSCGHESIVVLANRQPFHHEREADGEIVVTRSAGGLVTALEPLIQACGGVWVAHGAGTADRLVVDARDGVDVPPASPRYRLRRVWLDPDEARGYYDGFANEGLWPLCHRAHVQPSFRSEDFNSYRAVNAQFAAAVCEEVDSDCPVVLVQDYHFMLAPRAIRERLPLSSIVTFWHIPWPHPNDYAICPWGRQLLDGLLGSSLVGFQTPDDCRSFIDTVETSLDAHVDRRRSVITYRDRRTAIRSYPVSVEWPSRWACQSPPVETCRAAVLHQLGLPGDIRLAVGVDRLDYTKGLIEKFLAVERLLEMEAAFRRRLVLVQIAEPTRTALPAYQRYRSRVRETVDRINARFGAESYRPLILLEAHHDPAEVYRFLRAADVCYVGSLHDGMNLVAKEFVSSRNDDRGVLILSRFAGAAQELTEALMVNPYAIDESARTLVQALRMTASEQATRMRAMHATIAEHNAYRWAGELIADATRFRAAAMRQHGRDHARLQSSAVLDAVS